MKSPRSNFFVNKICTSSSLPLTLTGISFHPAASCTPLVAEVARARPGPRRRGSCVTSATDSGRGVAAEAGPGEVGSKETLRNRPAPTAGRRSRGRDTGHRAGTAPPRARGAARKAASARGGRRGARRPRLGGVGAAGRGVWASGRRRASTTKPPRRRHPLLRTRPGPSGRVVPVPQGSSPVGPGGALSRQTSRPRPLTSGSALHPRRRPGPRLRDLARRETGRRWRQWLLTPEGRGSPGKRRRRWRRRLHLPGALTPRFRSADPSGTFATLLAFHGRHVTPPPASLPAAYQPGRGARGLATRRPLRPTGRFLRRLAGRPPALRWARVGSPQPGSAGFPKRLVPVGEKSKFTGPGASHGKCSRLLRPGHQIINRDA